MDTIYEYMNEASISKELICRICHSPLVEPYCTPCGDTFCYKCIIDWIQTQTGSCPLCRQTISINTLTEAPHALRNILGQLSVKCIGCGQTELERIDFDEHIRKFCPKTTVFCPSADIKCPWTGQRDQLNQHLLDCGFVSMRPVIIELTDRNRQLEEQGNQYVTQITELLNKIDQLKEKENQYVTQILEQKKEIKRLKNDAYQQSKQTAIHQDGSQPCEIEVTPLITRIHTYQPNLQPTAPPPIRTPPNCRARRQYRCKDCILLCYICVFFTLGVGSIVGCFVAFLHLNIPLAFALGGCAFLFFAFGAICLHCKPQTSAS